jgi:uncharacterized membrane protein
MLNLEQAIAEWRRQMLAAGIKTPVPLEELEIHLREDIERQMESGLAEQKAFEISVPQIGQPQALSHEFKKSERPFMKPTAKIIIGIVGLCAGAALQIPGGLQLRDELMMAHGKLGLWLLSWLVIVGSLQQIIRPIGPIVWSVVQINRPKVFKGKFGKVALTPVNQPVKTGAGIVVLLIGVALMLPAAAQVCSEGLIRFEALCWMIFGLALLLGGGLVAFTPYKRRVA